MSKKKADSKFAVQGLVSGTVRNSDGSSFDFKVLANHVYEWEGVYYLLALDNNGAIKLGWDANLDAGQIPKVRFAEIERKDVPYGRGDGGTIEGFEMSGNTLKCESFKAELRGHDGYQGKLACTFDLTLSSD